jgi:hypothetical protein
MYLNSYCSRSIDGRKLKHSKVGCPLTFIPTLMNTHPLIKMLLWRGRECCYGEEGTDTDRLGYMHQHTHVNMVAPYERKKVE